MRATTLVLRRISILPILLLAAACDDGGSGSDEDTGAGVADTGDVEGGDATPDGSGDGDTGDVEGLAIPGLDGPVNVYVDAHGIPHIEGESDTDVAAALGYVHARDRFAQMDIRRRVTTGRLHQLIGELAMDVDESNRQLYSTPDGRPAEDALYEDLSDDSLALLEAYSAGVNAWLADLDASRNGAVLQDEYGFALVNVDVIPEWTPRDCLSTVLALINSLTNDSDRELALGDAYAAVPGDIASDLYGPEPGIVSTVMSSFEFPKSVAQPRVSAEAIARLAPARHAIQDALARVQAADILDPPAGEGDRGSNNWVLAPSMTSGGNALLSNDPHLGLSNPAVWYYAHIDSVTHGSGTYRAAGQSFAGIPWIVIGQNENIAWGATNSFFDMSDVYVETLSEDGDGVVFDGGVVPFTEVEYTMNPFDADAETRTLRFVPHHGPVLSVDEEAGTAISLAWTGNRVTTDANFLTELMRASTVDEARQALRLITTIGQNWVVIDTAGSIGWFPYNSVPARTWASMDTPSFLPIPGDGSAEWGDPIPYDDLPQLYNPESGYIATANNDMTGALSDGDPFNDGTTPLQVYVATGYRHARIVELLEAGAGNHDVDSMQAIVGDTSSYIGRELVPALLSAVEDVTFEGAGADVVAALEAWDFDCPSGVDGVSLDDPAVSDATEAASSVGCAAFHVLLGQLTGVFDDEIEEAGGTRGPSWGTVVRLVLRPESLELGDAWWDDVTTEEAETAADVITAGVNAAGAWLVDELGADPQGWRWGYLHTVTLRADLFDSFGVPTYNNGPWVSDGGLLTVDVANPRSVGSGDYSHSAGASTRFVCEAPETGVRCTVQLPGGQRHFRDSDNYQDLLLRWLANEPTELEFDIDVARDNAAATMEFIPAQ